MQFTDEVDWGVADFVVAGVLLFSAGLTYEVVARRVGNIAYRTAAGVAVAAPLILIWMNLAVGIIGSEDNPANLMYARSTRRWNRRRLHCALSAAWNGTRIVRDSVRSGVGRRNRADRRVGVSVSGPLELTLLNGFFVGLFAGSAWLFRRAAHGRSGI